MSGPTIELYPSHPTLDFRSLSRDQPAEIRAKGLCILDDAFRSHGFIYLSHHGIPESLVEAAFHWMKRFFDLPPATKLSIRRSTDPLKPRGYTTIGDAVLDQDAQPGNLAELANARTKAPVEQRETLELGNPYSQIQQRNLLLPEDEFPGFATWLENWWNVCMSLQLSLMGCFDEILTPDSPTPGHLVMQQDVDDSHSNMSLIHYHSVARSDIAAKDTSRCNAHTDSGQLTLLFQDNVGGLEVCDGKSPDGQTQFVAVPPKPGMIIVQLGDMLEKQSNGRWRSALHRVAAPSVREERRDSSTGLADAADVLQDRYSAAFFVYPKPDTKIEPLPGCSDVGPWNSMDWGNVQTAGEWWQKRIQLEFGRHQSKVARA